MTIKILMEISFNGPTLCRGRSKNFFLKSSEILQVNSSFLKETDSSVFCFWVHDSSILCLAKILPLELYCKVS